MSDSDLVNLFRALSEPVRYGPLRPLEEIVCVFGPANSGKSTYIAANYKKGETADDIMDIYNYQDDKAWPEPCGVPPRRRLLVAQALFETDVSDAVQKAARGSETGRLVLEGTFLKAARRAPLLQTIRNMAKPETKIVCVWFADDESCRMCIPYDGKAAVEVPTTDEEFDEVKLMSKADINLPIEELARTREEHKHEKERDIITEKDLLGYRALLEAVGADPDLYL